MRIPRPVFRPEETPIPPAPAPLPRGGSLAPAGHSFRRIRIDSPAIQRSPDSASPYSPIPDLESASASPYSPVPDLGLGGAGPYSPVPERGNVGGGYAAFPEAGPVSGHSPYSPVDMAAPPRTTLPEDNSPRTTLAEDRSVPDTLPAPPGPKLKGFSPGEQYQGEDKVFGWRANIGAAGQANRDSPDPQIRQAHAERMARPDIRVTKYLTPEQRAGYEKTAGGDGLLRGGDGRLLDTRGGAGGGHDATADAHLFALGTEGRLHTAGENEHDLARADFMRRQAARGVSQPAAAAKATARGKVDRMFHHSSFYAGGDVAGAGEIRAERGRLKEITDGSGHYKPGGEATFQTVAHLARSRAEGGLGVSMRDRREREARVTLIGKGDGQGRVSLPASSYLQTQGNEKQIRAKEGMLGELRGRNAGPVQNAAPARNGAAPAPAWQSALAARNQAARARRDPAGGADRLREEAPVLGSPDFGALGHGPRPATAYADLSALGHPAASGPYSDLPVGPYSDLPAMAHEDSPALGAPASGPYSAPPTLYDDLPALGAPASGPYSDPLIE